MNQRLMQLQKNLPQGCDGALITSFANRFYYSGVNSSAGLLLVTQKQAVFLADFRYIEDVTQRADGFEAVLMDEPMMQLEALCKKLGVTALAVESDLSVGEYFRYQKALAPVEIVADGAFSKAMAQQRSIKTPAEFVLLQKAQDIADKSFAELLNFIKAGRTELEIAAELAYITRKNGAAHESFDTIAVSGINSALPHGKPSEKVLQNGELFTLDFGVVAQGYCSDTTRTVAIGHITEEMHKIYDTVLEAQTLALAALKAGASLSGVDALARSHIEDAGYHGCFGHGLGHSLGIEIHEEPRLSPKAQGTAVVGNVLTVEPGIYLAGRFGCRIEDVVCITENGPVNLTHSPKNLVIL